MEIIDSLEELADIIFEIIPEDIQKQYEKDVFGNNLTLKDQFISYCEQNRKCPKYSRKKTKEIVAKALKENDFHNKVKFDFSIFDPVVDNYFKKYWLN